MGDNKKFICITIILGILIFILPLLLLNMHKASLRKTKQIIFKNTSDRFKEMAQRGTFGDQWNTNTEVQKAIDILSNGLFDSNVLFIKASVLPPHYLEHSDPIVRNAPRLVLWFVDELDQVYYLCYSDTKDRFAFGKPLISKRMYRELISEEIMPGYWYLYLNCDDPNKIVAPELFKLEHYSSQPEAILRLPVRDWNAMMSGQGQLILRDSKNLELARIDLTLPEDPNSRHLLNKLIIPVQEIK